MFWNICLWIYEFSAFCVALLILSGNIKCVKVLKEKAKRENKAIEFKGNFSILFSGIITNRAMIFIPLLNTLCAFSLIVQYDRFIDEIEAEIENYQFPPNDKGE